jgi:hypothetical protein
VPGTGGLSKSPAIDGTIRASVPIAGIGPFTSSTVPAAERMRVPRAADEAAAPFLDLEKAVRADALEREADRPLSSGLNGEVSPGSLPPSPGSSVCHVSSSTPGMAAEAMKTCPSITVPELSTTVAVTTRSLSGSSSASTP